jgi:hypothetical protein
LTVPPKLSTKGHAANHAEQRPEEERSPADAINQAERDDGRDKAPATDSGFCASLTVPPKLSTKPVSVNRPPLLS